MNRLSGYPMIVLGPFLLVRRFSFTGDSIARSARTLFERVSPDLPEHVKLGPNARCFPDCYPSASHFSGIPKPRKIIDFSEGMSIRGIHPAGLVRLAGPVGSGNRKSGPRTIPVGSRWEKRLSRARCGIVKIFLAINAGYIPQGRSYATLIRLFLSGRFLLLLRGRTYQPRFGKKVVRRRRVTNPMPPIIAYGEVRSEGRSS